MFGWFKRKAADAADGGTSQANTKAGGPLIAALLLEGESFPFAAFAQAMAGTQIAGKTPVNMETDKDGMAIFHVGDEMCAIALMPKPYPWSDLEGPCATSWMWPAGTSATSVKTARTHLLVTQFGGKGSAIERRLCLTGVTGVAAQQDGVMGVYWPEATLVHHPRLFAEMAKEITSPEAPPLYLWVDFRVFRNDDGTSGLFTTGMTALGHMEFEIPRIEMKPGELRDWAVNIAGYLLEKGPVLKHGETIGATAEQRLRISHTKSQFGHPGKVMRFDV